MDAPIWIYLVVVLVCLLIGRAILLYLEQSNSDDFANQFTRLGNLIGRSETEIIKVVGNPTRVDRVGNRCFYTWVKPAYEIALVFSDGVCQGIEHESRIDLLGSNN